MSSLTAQESSESNPLNPVNAGTTSSAPHSGSDPAVPFRTGTGNEIGSGSGSEGLRSGTIDKISAGMQNAAGSSEQRAGADLGQSGADAGADADAGAGAGSTGGKSASQSLLDKVEGSVHARGEGEHSRAV